MTSGKQTVQNVTTIYWGEKFYGPTKKGIYTSNNFTDKINLYQWSEALL